MQRGSRRAGGRQTWKEDVRIDGDAGNIRRHCQRGIGEIVGVLGDRRHVIEGSSAFIVAEEEHRVLPRRALHQRIDEGCNLCLAGQNGLPRTGMLIEDPIGRDDVNKARQRAVGHVDEILGDGRDVVGIDAVGIGGIADRLGTNGRRRGGRATGQRRVEVLKTVSEIVYVDFRKARAGGAAAVWQHASALRESIVNLPGNRRFGLI